MEPERSESYANTILRNAKRLHGLINDILDVTRIESQSLSLSKEQFNLEDLALNSRLKEKERTKTSSLNTVNQKMILYYCVQTNRG